MAKYTLSAVVNYPETEAETPEHTDLNSFEVASLILKLVQTEGPLGMTSALITIVKQKED